MSDKFTLTLNSPITEEQWDAITDVDFEHTNEITFHTKHGKEVKFAKASAQPERKKGHWIDTGEAIDNDTEVRCSECGEVLYWLSNFCPNCGCSMKEVKE